MIHWGLYRVRSRVGSSTAPARLTLLLYVKII